MELSKKQKILIPVTGIVVLFLGWELWGTFSKSAEGVSGPLVQTVSTPSVHQAPEKPVEENNTIAEINRFSKNQEVYLRAVNEYQLAEIQNRIAQVNASIAQSRTAEARALYEAEQIKVTVPPTSSSGALSNFSQDTYELAFIGKVANRWVATVKHGDSIIDLQVGTRFPDGGIVTDIDSNSVHIKNDSGESILTFNGVTERKLSPDNVSPAPDASNPKISVPVPNNVQPQNNNVPNAAPPLPTLPGQNSKSQEPRSEPLSQKATEPVVSAALTPVEQRLLNVDPAHFTIQMLTTPDVAKAQQFIVEYNLHGRAFSFRHKENGKLFYSLIFGQFATREEAEAMLKQFPKDPQMTPAIVSYATVQNEIKQVV